MDAKKSFEKIEITNDLVKELNAELHRTGLGPQAILRGTRNNRPPGLNSTLVKKWLTRSETSACKEQVDFIRQLWASFPDKKDVWIDLSDRKRQLLKTKLKETGLSASRLFSKRPDVPAGFNWKQLQSYFAPSQTRIRKEHYDFILKVCGENRNKGYATITEAMRESIQAEIRRTGMTPTRLILNASKSGNPKVKSHVVLRWLNKKVTRANLEEFQYVLDLYRQLPKKQEMQKSGRTLPGNIKINSRQIQEMRHYHLTLNILPGFIFKSADDTPRGLSGNIVGSWLNGRVKTAAPGHVEWVLERCRDLVEKAYNFK